MVTHNAHTHTIVGSALELAHAPFVAKIVINDSSLLSHAFFFKETNVQSPQIGLFRHDLLIPGCQWWWRDHHCRTPFFREYHSCCCIKGDPKGLRRQFGYQSRQEAGLSSTHPEGGRGRHPRGCSSSVAQQQQRQRSKGS